MPPTPNPILGSPPRAWGRRASARPRPPASRFTPTGVGTASSSFKCRTEPTVHPHGRGDGNDQTRRPFPCRGSPPRAWGRRRGPGRPSMPQRFTPTGVGTAIQRRIGAFLRPVHPHGRGDGQALRDPWGTPLGSPPRAWGRRGSVLPTLGKWRFTPTGVGTASPRFVYCEAATVHPHGRGDGGVKKSTNGGVSGSPPRAWGRPRYAPPFRAVARFTPTGVGTALPSCG